MSNSLSEENSKANLYIRKEDSWNIFYECHFTRNKVQRPLFFCSCLFPLRVPKSVKTESQVRTWSVSLIVSLVDNVRKERRFKSKLFSTIWAVANLCRSLDECPSPLSPGNLPMWRIHDLTYRRVIAQQLWSVTLLGMSPSSLRLSTESFWAFLTTLHGKRSCT